MSICTTQDSVPAQFAACALRHAAAEHAWQLPASPRSHLTAALAARRHAQLGENVRLNILPRYVYVCCRRDIEVRRLSCRALASLAQVMAGRQAIAAVGGVTVLTQALQTTPEAAAQALRVGG